MQFYKRLLAIASLCAVFNASGGDTITSAAGLYRAMYVDKLTDAGFDIRAKVIRPSSPKGRNSSIIIRDKTGAALIYNNASSRKSTGLSAGDVVRVAGRTRRHNSGGVFASATDVQIEGRGITEEPVPATAAAIANGEFDMRPVVVEGILRDVFRDEIDLSWVYVILQSGGKTLYGTFPLKFGLPHGLESSIGLDVSVTCVPLHPHYCSRQLIRTMLYMDSPGDIVPAAPDGTGPFDVPTLAESGDADVVFDAHSRRKVSGRVIADVGGGSILLRTVAGRILRVDLASADMPEYGASVEVSGIPTTDLYRVNLTCAVWRSACEIFSPEPAAEEILPSMLFTTKRGRPGLNVSYHGKTVAVKGRVLDAPDASSGLFNLKWGGKTLQIDVRKIPDVLELVVPGAVVKVCGICVVKVHDWNPESSFPHVEGFTVVARTPLDLSVVERPPLWTPSRLAGVIGSLIAVLVAILMWNRSLKALAERRGKALANEELEHLASDLKAAERTRLSAELHDSIAQNLSGVSMELDTVINGDEPIPPNAERHLSCASKTLDSCRVELRNCIWDLRRRTLDEPDMDSAIKVALSPTIGKAKLHVRFNVPRSRFSENTARAVLNIVRELASNAIRHGHAGEVWVAGSLDGDTLHFSVRDNGTGFDPESHPGVLEGHFGLQGIEERVATLEGEFQLESAPGKGTKAKIALAMSERT